MSTEISLLLRRYSTFSPVSNLGDPVQNQTNSVAQSDSYPGSSTNAYLNDGQYEDEATGFDVRAILAIARANIVAIGLIVGAAIILGAVSTLLQTPLFTAATTLQINDQSVQVLGKQDDLSQGQVTSAIDSERFLQTQLDILGSRVIAERVAQKLRLVGNAKFYEAMGMRQPAPQKNEREIKDQTLNALLGGINVSLPRSSRLARINFTSPTPALSARIANTWANEFIQANLQRRYDSSAYARQFISGQLDEARAKVEQSERDVNAYARQAGLIRTQDANSGSGQGREAAGGGSSVVTASLLQLNAQANQAEAVRIAAEQRWRSLSGAALLSSPDVLNNAAVSVLLAQRATTNSDLQRERARHLDDYPAVVQLTAQLASINAQLQSVAGNIRASVKQQYDSASKSEQALKAKVVTLKSSSLAEQDLLVQYNLLAREADTSRTVYDGLLQRYKELNAASGISSSNISIIDTADDPTRPSSPNLTKNLALALLIGLAASGLVVFLRTQFDDAVRLPEDIESKLRMPLLGVIPTTKGVTPAVAMLDPKSTISEAYNSLRSALLFSSTNGVPKTLLITSSQPSEGKSTTSLSIGIGFARLGRKVVIIDGDLRRPSLHRLIDCDNTHGMSSLLTSQDSIEASLRPTQYENLMAITSGPLPPSPTELLSSTRMQQVLEDLVNRFDLVVVDSPPVLGLADAPLMAGLVEGVVLVVQSERSRRGTLRSSLQRLRASRTNIIGAVLTMFDPEKVGNKYSEYYGYNYYQYKSEENS